ncbi:MAG TPA: Fic family protein [Conexibacter sp.]|jgi:Fic family protein|nr:Fic family protein [Conexibacter sp.]
MSDIPPALAFPASFRRYTPELATSLARIAGALGVIRGARVLPAVADELRASARVGTVHYSNLIEGNELPRVEAERAARGELEPETRAKVELIDYVEALDLIDERLDAGALELTPGLLKDLHRVATRGLGRDDDPHFKPHHEGEWRDGIALVVDRLAGRVMHAAPPADEVEPRMRSMFEWLARKRDEGESPFVLAGVMHYGITDVHPFADGNGRAARLFQSALLIEASVLPGRMFSFERYYAEDRPAYYEALRSVRRNTLNMEEWLGYFLTGLAEEYERVSERVVDLGSLLPGGSAPLRLTTGQQRALAALRAQGRREFGRRDYEDAAAVGRSAAGNDLRTLVQHGVLVLRGGGPGSRYAFARMSRTGSRRGRPSQWSDAKIERELRAFVVGRASWPTVAEFRAAEQGALYDAASRAGGIRRWRAVVGL